MFNIISPEKAGISSKYVLKFIKTLERRGLAMHSVLMMRGEDIFAEYYWKPFHKDFCHRMYSQTKSFVGIAIGLLEQDGALNLDDEICKHFPEKIDTKTPEFLSSLTIKQMLMMETCGTTPNWFYNNDPDRTHLYLNRNSSDHPAGTLWEYDSPGSQVLSALVEKLSGMTLFDFLNERIFKKLGTFKTASILKTKTDDSFGDSAMLCTTRDIASFARFVMNKGVWNGEQILNEDYINTATSRLADNGVTGFSGAYTNGYGYQIWRVENGFSFNGMGCQLTICIPNKDFIFACTADNQGYAAAKDLILTALYEIILDNLGDTALEENAELLSECNKLQGSLQLVYLKGNAVSPFAQKFIGKTYECAENECGISRFRIDSTSLDEGVLSFTNAQGDKKLPFGICKNVFTKFPQYGYSTDHAGLKNENGYLYNCAVSAVWAEEEKLQIKVQIIDDYLGNLLMTFCFKDDICYISMIKNAEAFLDEYQGRILAKRQA